MPAAPARLGEGLVHGLRDFAGAFSTGRQNDSAAARLAIEVVRPAGLESGSRRGFQLSTYRENANACRATVSV